MFLTRNIFLAIYFAIFCACCAAIRADPPVSSYIFPAGAQRGTAVRCRAAGLHLSSECGFEAIGEGIGAPAKVRSMPTLVLVGPYHHNPIAQLAWDYPKEMSAEIKLAGDARCGPRFWCFTTCEGATQLRPFIVGDLPEVLEEEERPAGAGPQQVTLPVTINGRIYPRADLDEYAFAAKAGETVSCEVMSQRLGNKLDAMLELRAGDGRVLAQNDDGAGCDPLLFFSVPADGTYALRIHDIAFEGDPDYVYRLTLRPGPFVTRTFPAGGRRGSTAKIRLHGAGLGAAGFIDNDVALPAAPAGLLDWDALRGSLPERCHVSSPFWIGDDPELIEVEPNDDAARAQRLTLPAAINGQIAAPGDADEYVVSARKGRVLEVELLARRLGSPLAAVWIIIDASGSEVARKEGDGRVELSPGTDAEYRLRVQELHRESRGGPEYVYRILLREREPDFRLALERDAVGVLPGQTAKVKLTVHRPGGFQGDIQLSATGLPAGVAMAPGAIAAGQGEVELSFTALKEAPVGTTRRAVVIGLAVAGGRRLLHAAEVPSFPAGAAAGPPLEGTPPIDSLAVTVVHPPLFTIATEEVYGAAHRGATHLQKFTIERAPGFDGEITLDISDRQARYLQGATGPSIVLKPGEKEIVYPVFFPEVMDLNRTERILLRGAARVTDAAGNVHFVTHTTQKQLIARVEPALLTLAADGDFLEAKRGTALKVPLHVGRAPGLVGPITIEAELPPGMKGFAAAPATLKEGEEAASITIQVAPDADLSREERILFRATGSHQGYPVVAESAVEIGLSP